MAALSSVYVNNVLYLHDPDAGTLVPQEPGYSSLTVAEVQQRPEAYHFANLWIVDINGHLYYDDARLKEFRRVDEPSLIIRYDNFVPVDEGGTHRLTRVDPHSLPQRLFKARQRSRPRRR